GIGKSTAAKIDELVGNKSLKELDELLAITPTGVLSIMTVKGIGPKKASAFWKELGIDTLGALWYACNEDKISKLKGFGAKTQQEIKQLVEFTVANQGKFRFADALPFAKELSKALSAFSPKPAPLS